MSREIADINLLPKIESPENVEDAVEQALARIVRIMDLIAENPANFSNALSALEDAHQAINLGTIADKKSGMKILRNHPKRTEIIQSLAYLKHTLATASLKQRTEMNSAGFPSEKAINAFEEMFMNIFPTQLDKEVAKLAANDNDNQKAKTVA